MALWEGLYSSNLCGASFKIAQKEGAGIQGTSIWDSLAGSGMMKPGLREPLLSSKWHWPYATSYDPMYPILKRWPSISYVIYWPSILDTISIFNINCTSIVFVYQILKFSNCDIGDLEYWHSILKFVTTCDIGHLRYRTWIIKLNIDIKLQNFDSEGVSWYDIEVFHDVPVLIPKNTTNSIVIWTANCILFPCSIHFPPFHCSKLSEANSFHTTSIRRN